MSEELERLRQQHARYVEITGGPLPAAQARERNLQKLREQRNALAVQKLEESEAWLLNQESLENQLGGRLVEGAEIDDFILNRQLALEEIPERAVNYANTSGRLPEGARAFAVEDNDGNTVYAYKMPGENKFYHINDPGASKSDVGKYLGPLASLEFVAGVASAFSPISKIKWLSQVKYAEPAARAVAEGGAAAIGRLGDEMVEGATVGELDELDQLIYEASESFRWGAGGSLVGSGLGAGVNRTAGRRGITPEEEEAKKSLEEVFAAEERRGLETLGAGDFDRPIFERIQAIASATSAEAREREIAKLEKPARLLIMDAAGVDDISDLSDKALLDLIRQEKRNSKRVLQNRLKEGNVDFRSTSEEVGGEALYETITKYRTQTSIEGNANYSAVFDQAEKEGITFDATEVIKVASEAIEKQRILGRVKEVKPDFMDRMLGTEPIPQPPQWLEVDNLVEGKLEQVLSTLSDMNEMQPTEALGALRKVMQNLRGLADPNPGSVTRNPSQKAANDVLLAMNDMINRSAGSKEYQSLVQKANSAWRQRSRDLKAFGWMKDLSDQTGGGQRAYNRVVSGDLTTREAVFLKNNMSRQQRDQFLNAFYTDMMRSPEKIPGTISRLDVAGNVLIPKQALEAVEAYSRAVDKTNASFLTSLVKSHAEEASRIKQLVDRGSVSELKALVSNGDLTRDQLKKSIFHNFVESSTDYQKGRFLLNKEKFNNAYKRMEQNGVLKLMDPGSRELLSDLRLYSSFLKQGSDAGNSIAAANITAAISRGATEPAAAANASVHLYQLSVLSRWAHNKRVRLAVVGTANSPKDHHKLRASLVGSALYLREIQNENEGWKDEGGEWSPLTAP